MSISVGEIIDGTVSDVMNYGAFVKLKNGQNGLVHISEISKDYVEDIHSVMKKGDNVKVKVISVDEKGKIALSIRKAISNNEKKVDSQIKKEETLSLDEMLSKFLKDSDERQLDLKRNFESRRSSSRKRA